MRCRHLHSIRRRCICISWLVKVSKPAYHIRIIKKLAWMFPKIYYLQNEVEPNCICSGSCLICIIPKWPPCNKTILDIAITFCHIFIFNGKISSLGCIMEWWNYHSIPFLTTYVLFICIISRWLSFKTSFCVWKCRKIQEKKFFSY